MELDILDIAKSAGPAVGTANGGGTGIAMAAVVTAWAATICAPDGCWRKAICG
jgi:L-alanine-DL-glutamate epimerase-like enolase superfamily enzyme